MAFSLPLWEVQTGGDDTNNGGGFDTGVAGFPTDGAATSATGTAPVFTSASYNFVSPGDVGHWIFIKSGTNWTPGWYKISSVASNAATLDATTGHCPLYDANCVPGRINGLNSTSGCATVASPTSATWGIDYSQSSARFTSTHFSTDATNTHLLDADNTIGKNWVGNIVSVTTAGTGFTIQRVAVVSTSGTTATCDKTLGGTNLSGGGGKVGGPLASLGKAASVIITNGGIWIKSGSYSVTSASTNVAAGCYSVNGAQRVEGYGTYRTDMAAIPIFTASGISTATFMTNAGGIQFWRNIKFDGASLTSTRGFQTASGYFEGLIAANCTNVGIAGQSSSAHFNCIATGCSTTLAGFEILNAPSLFICCVSYSNSVMGFEVNNLTGVKYIFCIAANNSGTSDGFRHAGNDRMINCTSYGNGRDGFRPVSSVSLGHAYFNCIAENNTVTGFNSLGTGNVPATIRYCATEGNGTSGITTSNIQMITDSNLVYTQTAFTKTSTNDFSLNTRHFGGSQLRGTAWPGAFANGQSTGYVDFGAAQAPFAILGQGGVGFWLQ